ncbi:lytic transglycosylase domain-containing protein [Ferribacterium limneticum]|uniref:lytic transglycosylase domain-containing protein n=1 Tax=Ferribacterium limneticum TaxID=76259 RepID=UPI001CF80085|nr:lytic transglycosylase domain-containing protein [Ferribacterium limneticum]UCV26686.1 lytic transglycosylase domain-containing protein [Ferribacterium limneticum]UCV30603.1 lytic transglycosylase domain-containing protein [Ferribacterium limneticum]
MRSTKRSKQTNQGQRPWLLLAFLAAFSITPPAVADLSEQGKRAAAIREEAKSFEHGNGNPRNPEKALELYCEAARLNDMEAQYNAGWMYAMGRGIPRDDATAAYFFAMAAKQGDALAARMLRQVGEPATKPPACLFDTEGNDIVEKSRPEHRKVMDLVQKLAPEYGVSPRLVMAIIRAESNFNPGAVSPKNAQGLMQLIPETAERFNVKKPFDPEQNIRGGLAYLRWLLAYFQGNIELVAAAYNAGEGAVNRYAGVPPYAETQGYVARIKEIFKRQDHPFDAQVTSPSPELHRINASRRMM